MGAKIYVFAQSPKKIIKIIPVRLFIKLPGRAKNLAVKCKNLHKCKPKK